MMDGQRDIFQTAHDRAAIYAPPSNGNPVAAGIAGALVVYIAVTIFAAISLIDPDEFGTERLVTTFLGFLVPFSWMKLHERAHHTAFLKEYRLLAAEEEIRIAREQQQQELERIEHRAVVYLQSHPEDELIVKAIYMFAGVGIPMASARELASTVAGRDLSDEEWIEIKERWQRSWDSVVSVS